MNIYQHLSETAVLFPETPALIFEGRKISYRQLLQQVDAASQVLAEHCQAGDRVAIVLGNVPAFAVWYFATVKLGCIAVSISTRLTVEETGYMVGDSGANILVSTGDRVDDMAQAELAVAVEYWIAVDDFADQFDLQSATPARQAVKLCDVPVAGGNLCDCQADQAAVILYTSGTTGFAKGATLSHGNVRSNVHAFNHLCHMRPGDRVLLAVPLFHCFGQNALLNSVFNAGGTLILLRQFGLSLARQAISTYSVNQLYGVPMMFQLLLEHCQAEELASVGYCFSAAAPLSLVISQKWLEKYGLPICEGYGLTETSPFASYNHRLQYKLGSIGTPIDSVEMKIVDVESGEPCPDGQAGEIVIRGPNVMLGYWNRPEDTQQAIRDGWFYSGDIGSRHADGFFYLLDRKKDMISIGGVKVFPAEVERVLLECSLVSDAAVVGVPDPVLGEQVLAVLVAKTSEARGGNSDESLAKRNQQVLEFLSSRVASFKLPRNIEWVEQLPRNPAGKILKTELRKQFAGSLAAVGSAESAESVSARDTDGSPVVLPDSTNPSHDGAAGFGLREKFLAAPAFGRRRVVEQYVQALVLKLCGQQAGEEDRFLDLGFDSLMIVELSTQLQAELGGEVELSPTLLFDHPQVGNLIEFLQQLLDEIAEPTGASAARSENEEGGDEKLQPETTHNDSGQIHGMSSEEVLDELWKELEGT